MAQAVALEAIDILSNPNLTKVSDLENTVFDSIAKSLLSPSVFTGLIETQFKPELAIQTTNTSPDLRTQSLNRSAESLNYDSTISPVARRIYYLGLQTPITPGNHSSTFTNGDNAPKAKSKSKVGKRYRTDRTTLTHAEEVEGYNFALAHRAVKAIKEGEGFRKSRKTTGAIPQPSASELNPTGFTNSPLGDADDSNFSDDDDDDNDSNSTASFAGPSLFDPRARRIAGIISREITPALHFSPPSSPLPATQPLPVSRPTSDTLGGNTHGDGVLLRHLGGPGRDDIAYRGAQEGLAPAPEDANDGTICQSENDNRDEQRQTESSKPGSGSPTDTVMRNTSVGPNSSKITIHNRKDAAGGSGGDDNNNNKRPRRASGHRDDEGEYRITDATKDEQEDENSRHKKRKIASENAQHVEAGQSYQKRETDAANVLSHWNNRHKSPLPVSSPLSDFMPTDLPTTSTHTEYASTPATIGSTSTTREDFRVETNFIPRRSPSHPVLYENPENQLAPIKSNSSPISPKSNIAKFLGSTTTTLPSIDTIPGIELLAEVAESKTSAGQSRLYKSGPATFASVNIPPVQTHLNVAIERKRPLTADDMRHSTERPRKPLHHMSQQERERFQSQRSSPPSHYSPLTASHNSPSKDSPHSSASGPSPANYSTPYPSHIVNPARELPTPTTPTQYHDSSHYPNLNHYTRPGSSKSNTVEWITSPLSDMAGPSTCDSLGTADDSVMTSPASGGKAGALKAIDVENISSPNTFRCPHEGCTAPAFQTQYLLKYVLP